MTDCLLLFSGGVDSMLTAAKLACSDCRVHLLCCNNGSIVHEEIFPTRSQAPTEPIWR